MPGQTHTPMKEDVNRKYGGIEPIILKEELASIGTFIKMIVRPLKNARTTWYTVLAQQIPGVRMKQPSGRVSVPGQVAGNLRGQVQFDCMLPERVLGFEVWNYDASNALTLSINAEEGGMTQELYLTANSYYTTDINLPAGSANACVATLYNANASAINAQFIWNGM